MRFRRARIVSGVSPNSETLRIAGERGFYAMTPMLNSLVVKSQSDSVEEGAALYAARSVVL